MNNQKSQLESDLQSKSLSSSVFIDCYKLSLYLKDLRFRYEVRKGSIIMVLKKLTWTNIKPYSNQKAYKVYYIINNMVNKLKSINLSELKESYEKVLYWFFSFPQREIGLNDISTEVGISKTNAKIIINQLVAEGFLNKQEIGKAWRISSNPHHLYNLSRKIGYNLRLVYESGIVQQVREMFPAAKAIVLFGSYRKGDDNEKSDIDIAVEVLDNQEVRIHQLGVFSNFGYRAKVPVNLHIFSRNKIDLNLFANVANGIVLDGFLEASP